MSTKEDYYSLLKVSKTASAEEIKKAYRKKAMKHHPDKEGGCEDKFKAIKEAYEVLSDTEKRNRYDRFGHDGLNQQHGGGHHGFDPFSGFGDAFHDFFSGGNNQQTPRGEDIKHRVDITLEEAAFGAKVQIKVPTKVKCTPCNGTGAKSGTSPIICGSCQGHGQVRIQQGMFQFQQTCPTCRGSGKIIKDFCQSCHGNGLVQEIKTLEINIPVGIDSNNNLQMSGQGHFNTQGQRGNLYIEVNIKPHKVFTRDNNNLYCKVDVTFETVCLGGTIKVPTLTGEVTLTIPKGTQTGTSFKLAGKGIKTISHAFNGDIICKVNVVTPNDISDEQKLILSAFSNDDKSYAKNMEGIKKIREIAANNVKK